MSQRSWRRIMARKKALQEKAIASHPEVQWLYSVLAEVYNARKAHDDERLASAFTAIDSYVEGIIEQNKKASSE